MCFLYYFFLCHFQLSHRKIAWWHYKIVFFEWVFARNWPSFRFCGFILIATNSQIKCDSIYDLLRVEFVLWLMFYNLYDYMSMWDVVYNIHWWMLVCMFIPEFSPSIIFIVVTTSFMFNFIWIKCCGKQAVRWFYVTKFTISGFRDHSIRFFLFSFPIFPCLRVLSYVFSSTMHKIVVQRHFVNVYKQFK